MKKFFKFIFGMAAFAGIAAGGYYAYKKFVAKDDADDFDDFEDDLDDLDLDDAASKEEREYVSIDISSDSIKEQDAAAEDKAEEATF